jgi:hypothetical protein
LGYIHVWGYGYCDWWWLVELRNWWMVLLMTGWSQDIHGLIDDSLSTSFMKNRLDYWERNWFLGWWVTDIIIWPSLHGLKFEPVLAITIVPKRSVTSSSLIAYEGLKVLIYFIYISSLLNWFCLVTS